LCSEKSISLSQRQVIFSIFSSLVTTRRLFAWFSGIALPFASRLDAGLDPARALTAYRRRLETEFSFRSL